MKYNNQPITQLKGFQLKTRHDNFLEEMVKAWTNQIRLKRAIKLAEAKRKATRKEYYVMEGRGSLLVFNSKERKQLVRLGIFSKEANHIETIERSFYYTGWNQDIKLKETAKMKRRLKISRASF